MSGTTDRAIPDALLQRLSDYLIAKVGLHFAKRTWKELQQKMSAAMTDFGFLEVEKFITWLLAFSPTQQQIEILAGHLTVGETYFFREKRAFEILENSLLPGLIAARRQADKRLRFWSAGCSTGEEPYSLAILLDKLIPDRKDWQVTILATDINAGALEKAEMGIYSDWSFRDNPPWFKERYFEKVDGTRHRLLPEIRKMVNFSYLNLSEDHYPALQNNTNAMDCIFCRNVLMYFAPQQISLTVERFYRSLLAGGSLLVSPVETALLTHSPFVGVRYQDATIYQKDSPKTMVLQEVNECPENSDVPGSSLLPLTVKHHRSKISLSTIKPTEAELTPYATAALLYQKGHYREAESELLQLASEGDKEQETCLLLIKVLANQGKLAEAHSICTDALLTDKCNAQLHYLLATILEEQKKDDEAKNSLKKALYLDRNFVLAHFALANFSLRAGKAAEARKHFRHAAEILSGYNSADIIPASEGITVGRLAETIATFGMREK